MIVPHSKVLLFLTFYGNHIPYAMEFYNLILAKFHVQLIL